jgi:hypothetical protein
MLWEAVDNGSLSTPHQSEIGQEETLPSNFGSPFPNELFEFSPLGYLSPMGYLSPFRSCPSPNMAANLNQALRHTNIGTNSRQENDVSSNAGSRSFEPAQRGLNFDMPRL